MQGKSKMNTPDQPDLYSDDQSYPEMLQARKVALDLLGQVLTRKIPLDQTLDSSASLAALSGRDRAFTRMLVATTLRRLRPAMRTLMAMFARLKMRRRRSSSSQLRLR